MAPNFHGADSLKCNTSPVVPETVQIGNQILFRLEWFSFGPEIVCLCINREEQFMGPNVEMHMPKEFLDSFTLFIEL
jgi:hypothetical protein